jgi:hypothetical protein
MRQKPPYLPNPEFSTIRFNNLEFGLIDGSFSSACLTHGDGQSFSWIAGGGELTYAITRVTRGFAHDDGTAVSCWEFSQTNQQNEVETAYINIPAAEVLDTLGDPAPFRMINQISDAVIDLGWEAHALSRGLSGVIAEDLVGKKIFLPLDPDNEPQ